MKVELCFLVAQAVLAAQPCFTLMSNRPSADELVQFYQANNWESMRDVYANATEYPLDALGFHLYGAALTSYSYEYLKGMTVPMFNLSSLFLYNLDVDGCRTDALPITYNNDANLYYFSITMAKLMALDPCFRNHDRIVFGAYITMGVGTTDPLLFPGVFRIENIQRFDGFHRGYVRYANSEIGLNAANGFFWDKLEYVEVVTAVEECPRPSLVDFQLFERAKEPTPAVGFDFNVDPLYGPQSIQVAFLPSTFGCDVQTKTIYGPGPVNLNFGNCAGVAYATWIFRGADQQPICGHAIPLFISIHPRASNAAIKFPNTPAEHAAKNYWYENVG